MPEVMKLFLIIYALVKNALPFETTSKSAYLALTKKLITIQLSIILLSIIFAILLPFALFRLSLRIVLKILHGELYGGPLNGLDAVFETNTNKTVVNVILIYSSKDKTSLIIEKLKNCIYQIYHSSFKFSSSIMNIFGYCFYLKKQVKFEDIVDVAKYNNDEYMTRNMLFDYLQKKCATIEKNQMWKVVIFSQPIHWHKNNAPGYKQYAIIWTLRHSLGDGPSIVTIFQKYAVEDRPPQNPDTNYIQNITGKKNAISLDNVYVRRNPATTKLDGDFLKIEEASNWQIASFHEQDVKYIPLIKKVKAKLNANFTEVLSATICASIFAYIKQRKVKMDNFTMGTVIRLRNDDLLKLKHGTYDFEKITNNFGLLALNLPLNLDKGDIKSIISYIHDYNESLRYAVDPLIAYVFLCGICTYLPVRLIRSSCKLFMDRMTIGITNLRGFQKSKWCDNNIDDAFFYLPDFLNTGFLFSIFSYDGRLQITLTSRKGFVHNQEELQTILDNVFKYLDKIEQEILVVEHL